MEPEEKPLSQPEAYKVADWLRENGKIVEAAIRDLWRKTPGDVASEYGVGVEEIVHAAGRK